MSYNGRGTDVSPARQPVATCTVIQWATSNTLVTEICNTSSNVFGWRMVFGMRGTRHQRRHARRGYLG